MVEELRGDHCTDRVTTLVLGSGPAAAITKEPGDRVQAARLQIGTEHVALCHTPIIARPSAPVPMDPPCAASRGGLGVLPLHRGNSGPPGSRRRGRTATSIAVTSTPPSPLPEPAMSRAGKVTVSKWTIGGFES